VPNQSHHSYDGKKEQKRAIGETMQQSDLQGKGIKLILEGNVLGVFSETPLKPSAQRSITAAE
jgi:hypothetical protein